MEDHVIPASLLIVLGDRNGVKKFTLSDPGCSWKDHDWWMKRHSKRGIDFSADRNAVKK
jgi:hypothetical protein